jgi:hypothetical protein
MAIASSGQLGETLREFLVLTTTPYIKGWRVLVCLSKRVHPMACADFCAHPALSPFCLDGIVVRKRALIHPAIVPLGGASSVREAYKPCALSIRRTSCRSSMHALSRRNGPRDLNSSAVVAVENILIRPAQSFDLDQLALLREALWPKSCAGDHAEDLRLMLGGKAALTMPLTILVAEASDGTLVGFLEVDLRSHADGCNPSRPVGYIEGWYVSEDQDIAE